MPKAGISPPVGLDPISPESIDHLADRGWCVVDLASTLTLADQLHRECIAKERQSDLVSAGIGSRTHHHVNQQVRGDRIQWWIAGQTSPPQTQFLDLVERLRMLLNRSFFLALHDAEIHYALYPPGAGYQPHIDQFSRCADRQISLVYYLNPNWTPEAGGQLRLHLNDGPLDIDPMAGRLVLFRSALILHEVLPATRTRASVVGWLRNRPLNRTNA